MNTQKPQQLISIELEVVIQLLELSDRLIKLGYGSRTEANFVKNIGNDIVEVVNQINKPVEQNNKVDETIEPIIPLE